MKPWWYSTPDLLQLQSLRVGVQEMVGEYALSRMRYDRQALAEHPDQVFHRLTTEILAYCTGPQIYRDSATATARVVRFASWWDHFKASYRRRWWMSWRHWRVQYRWQEETATAVVEVRAELAAIFPHADVLPDNLGRPYAIVLTHSPR